MSAMSFPKSVKPLRKIGTSDYSSGDKPCCSFGHAAYVLSNGENFNEDGILKMQSTSKPYAVFNSVYRLVYEHLCDIEAIQYTKQWSSNATDVSDNVDHTTRVLIYNLSWAVLGYESDQSKKTLEHVDTAREYVMTHLDADVFANGMCSGHVHMPSIKRLITNNLKGCNTSKATKKSEETPPNKVTKKTDKKAFKFTHVTV